MRFLQAVAKRTPEIPVKTSMRTGGVRAGRPDPGGEVRGRQADRPEAERGQRRDDPAAVGHRGLDEHVEITGQARPSVSGERCAPTTTNRTRCESMYRKKSLKSGWRTIGRLVERAADLLDRGDPLGRRAHGPVGRLRPVRLGQRSEALDASIHAPGQYTRLRTIAPPRRPQAPIRRSNRKTRSMEGAEINRFLPVFVSACGITPAKRAERARD